MHTDAQSAKKDVISTKPQKGRASRGPKKHKKKHNRTSFPGYPCQMSPFSGHAILCKQGRQGRGAVPPVRYWCVGVSSLGAWRGAKR